MATGNYTGGAEDSRTRTSAGRVRTPVFSNTRFRWVRAVFVVIFMRSAISKRERPSTTRPAICFWVGERAKITAATSRRGPSMPGACKLRRISPPSANTQ